MKKKIVCISLLVLTVLCACTEKKMDEKTVMTPTPRVERSVVDDNKPSATTAATAPVNTSGAFQPETLEALDWKTLSCFADEKTSIQNSNLLNGGYITYDEAGNIYFVDRNIGGIFVSDWNGENRRQLSPNSARGLQIEEGWLYCQLEDGLNRIHIETGKEERVYEGAFGEFLIVAGKLYMNAPGGFYVMELDGTGKMLLREENPQMVSYVAGDAFWLGTAIDETDVTCFLEGHLIVYDAVQDKQFYIDKGSWYPLLAGNWLSVFDLNTASRHVWNLETDEIVDLEVYAQKAVSDGERLYYVKQYGEDSWIYCWNGTEAVQIMEFAGGRIADGMFLTPKALYCMPEVRVEQKKVCQLWYYNLETEEIGMIY